MTTESSNLTAIIQNSYERNLEHKKPEVGVLWKFRICLRRLDLTLERWEQYGHWKRGSFPHSFWMWLLRELRHLYVRPQRRHGNSCRWGWLPLWSVPTKKSETRANKTHISLCSDIFQRTTNTGTYLMRARFEYLIESIWGF